MAETKANFSTTFMYKSYYENADKRVNCYVVVIIISIQSLVLK